MQCSVNNQWTRAWTTLISAGRTTQWGTRNLDFWSPLMTISWHRWLRSQHRWWRKEGALLGLTLTKKEKLAVGEKFQGNFGAVTSEVVEVKILRGGSGSKWRTTALDFRRADFNLIHQHCIQGGAQHSLQIKREGPVTWKLIQQRKIWSINFTKYLF